MLWFWILTVAMILLGLGFIIPSLLSKKVATSVASDEVNIAIYSQKLTELDRNEENLDTQQLKQARQELEQGLLQDVDSPADMTSASPLKPKTQIMVAAIVAVIMPVAALLLYAELAPEQWTQMVEYDPATARETAEAKAKLPSIDAMVAKLEAKLQKNPTDPKGWAMLGRSYFIMRRYDEAANAYAQANKLSDQKNLEILVDYAESLAMANDGNIQGKAGKLLARALTLQPQHPKALWLAGTAAFQHEKYKQAVQLWGTLLAMHPDKSNEGAQVLQKQIAEARRRLGDKAPPAVTQKPNSKLTLAKTVVKVSVKLDAALKARTAPTDTIFIYARAEHGPAMPLTIVKKQVRDLPFTVSLNDAMTMVPGMTMSSFSKIYISARVSKTANATPQSGDLQGRSSAINTGKTQKVSITINQEVH